MIRPAQAGDADAIARIYNHYISTTVITFEESEVSEADVAQRIADTGKDGLPWLVFEREGSVAGYAYASLWNGRCAYRYTAEVTVYLAPDALGAGLGSQLYGALFEVLKQRSYRTVIAGISLPNDGSIALHEKFGMKKVAHFEEVGYKFERWIDVGYWQGLLCPEAGQSNDAAQVVR